MTQVLIIDSNPADLERDAGLPRDGALYAEALRACDASVGIDIVAPYDGDTTPDLSGYDGIVFTGSRVDWAVDDPRAAPLAAVMRAALAAGRPIMGSCNGMQLAVLMLGGTCAASPNGREDGLARDIRITEAGLAHPMMAGRESGYAMPCIHRDEISALPEGAVLLAGNAHSPVQAFCYEQDGLRVWGVQYHPEYSAPYIAGVMKRLKMMPSDQVELLARADRDPAAALSLGLREPDLTARMRLSELRNWLAQL